MSGALIGFQKQKAKVNDMSVTLYKAGTTLKDIMDMKVGEGLKVGSDIPDFDETNVGNVLRVVPKIGEGFQTKQVLEWDKACHVLNFTTEETEVSADFERADLLSFIQFNIPFVFCYDGTYFSTNYTVILYDEAISELYVQFILDDSTSFTMATIYYDADTLKYMVTEKDYVAD